MDPATYSAQEKLRDGRPVEIRALRLDDETEMLAAIDRTGAESLQRRFFVTRKREFSDKEKAFFMNVDFVDHVALVAELCESGKPAIIAGGRYVASSGEAEVAFVVIDKYQGQGLGSMLARHLIGIARAAGLTQLVADVLPENRAMRRVLEKLGFRTSRSVDPQVVRLKLSLL